MSVHTVENAVTGDAAGRRPPMPATLVLAAFTYVVCAVLVLAAKVVAFMAPDPYSGARPVAREPEEWALWAGWLIPIAVVVFALLIRGGGNGVRVALTVLAGFLGLAAYSVTMDRDPGEGTTAEVLFAALLAFAVVLHYLPVSGAYVRAVRRWSPGDTGV